MQKEHLWCFKLRQFNLTASKNEVATTVSASEIKRIRRLMTPREDGSYLVPDHFVNLWKDVKDGGREQVKKLWLESGGDKDLFTIMCTAH